MEQSNTTTPPSAIVQRDLARAISAIENGHGDFAAARAMLQRSIPHLHPASPSSVFGITGPPGAGKSTIIDRLIERFREQGYTVAVIAVDPSSPFTEGAVLGDRVRMQRHINDPGVFVRSMASRQASGGLAPTTRDAISLVQLAGFEIVMIETVGVGQLEVDVVSLAHTVVVVTVPGLGDDVQAIKAGLTEVGDIFVVNMADRPGADKTVLDLEQLLRTRSRPVSVLKTIATADQGIDALAIAVQRANDRVTPNDERDARIELMMGVRDAAVQHATRIIDAPLGREIVRLLQAKHISRADAVHEIMCALLTSVTNAHQSTNS